MDFVDSRPSPHGKWSPGQWGQSSAWLLLGAVNSDSLSSPLPASLFSAGGRCVAPVFAFAFISRRLVFPLSYSFRKLRVSSYSCRILEQVEMNLRGLSLQTHSSPQGNSLLAPHLPEGRAPRPVPGVAGLPFCAAHLGARGRGAERRQGGAPQAPPSCRCWHLLMQRASHLPGVAGSGEVRVPLPSAYRGRQALDRKANAGPEHRPGSVLRRGRPPPTREAREGRGQWQRGGSLEAGASLAQMGGGLQEARGGGLTW